MNLLSGFADISLIQLVLVAVVALLASVIGMVVMSAAVRHLM